MRTTIFNLSPTCLVKAQTTAAHCRSFPAGSASEALEAFSLVLEQAVRNVLCRSTTISCRQPSMERRPVARFRLLYPHCAGYSCICAVVRQSAQFARGCCSVLILDSTTSSGLLETCAEASCLRLMAMCICSAAEGLPIATGTALPMLYGRAMLSRRDTIGAIARHTVAMVG